MYVIELKQHPGPCLFVVAIMLVDHPQVYDGGVKGRVYIPPIELTAHVITVL